MPDAADFVLSTRAVTQRGETRKATMSGEPWACDACTFMNTGAGACSMCGTPHASAAAPAPAPTPAPAPAPASGTAGGKTPEGEQCPICSGYFPAATIEAHAMACLSAASTDEGKTAADEDPDAAMAKRLAAQFAAEDAARTFPCRICNKQFGIETLYTLDECSHRFCRPCLQRSIVHQLEEGALSSEVACSFCSKPMSIRDVQDFTRRATGPGTVSVAGTAGAARRLHKELKMIQKAGGDKLGFTVALVGDSLYEWEVKVFGFDKKDAEEGALAKDIERAGGFIVMRLVFPSDYPSKPPYVRVIRPRFKFRTGHVTIGGAICTEALSSAGWDPSMTVESVLIGVRTNMVVGGGRIDHSNKTDYSAREAKVAFDRMMRTHGWV